MSLTSLNRLRSISSSVTVRSTPSLAIRADSRRVSVNRLARPVRASVRDAAVLRNMVLLRWFSDTMTTDMDGSAHGPSSASAASSGAVIRLIPQIRTLLPNRSRCTRQVDTRNWVSASPINSEYSTTTTTASARPQNASSHGPGGISGSTISANPENPAIASPIRPKMTMFSADCHHRPDRRDNAAVNPLIRNRKDALGP